MKKTSLIRCQIWVWPQPLELSLEHLQWLELYKYLALKMTLCISNGRKIEDQTQSRANPSTKLRPRLSLIPFFFGRHTCMCVEEERGRESHARAVTAHDALKKQKGKEHRVMREWKGKIDPTLGPAQSETRRSEQQSQTIDGYDSSI